MADKRYWIALNCTPGIGPVKIERLLKHFGDLEAAWQATPLQLAQAGLDRRSLTSLQHNREQLDLPALLAKIEKQNIRVLTWADDDYPERLRHIAQSPPVLYLRGELHPGDQWAVAVVGTRKPSHYGREVARRIAETLAAAGVTVVSGLARGIDALAHKGALEMGGRTLAVLGSGVDHIYPAEHKGLADKIIAAGALVSDYAPGTRPEAGNFPARNRLISALSQATVIVEAGARSGALITAEFAAEQGREVYAVPGSILSQQSIGPNRLIADGARPLLSAEALLEDLNLNVRAAQSSARAILAVDPAEQLLLDVLSSDPVHVDELSRQTGMQIAQVSSLLAMLELKGLIRQTGGMHYVTTREASAG